MKYTFSDHLLFFLAAWADYNRRFSWQLVGAASDDPRLTFHRRRVLRYLNDKKKKQKLYSTLHSLKKNGFLKEKIAGDFQGYVLTPKGKTRIFRLSINNIKKKKLPPGQYLMVFFDVPEKLRQNRDIFRVTLKELGFEKIQRSVWITSYKVKNELEELIKDCGLEKYTKALLVKELKR